MTGTLVNMTISHIYKVYNAVICKENKTCISCILIGFKFRIKTPQIVRIVKKTRKSEEWISTIIPYAHIVVVVWPMLFL